MSKILRGTCQNGVVREGDAIVPEAVLLSEGVGASEGLVILEEDEASYIAKTSPDLKTTLEKLIAALGQISTAINSLDTRGFLIGVTGATPIVGPPALSGTVSQINSAKEDLETLKGDLR